MLIYIDQGNVMDSLQISEQILTISQLDNSAYLQCTVGGCEVKLWLKSQNPQAVSGSLGYPVKEHDCCDLIIITTPFTK